MGIPNSRVSDRVDLPSAACGLSARGSFVVQCVERAGVEVGIDDPARRRTLRRRPGALFVLAGTIVAERWEGCDDLRNTDLSVHVTRWWSYDCDDDVQFSLLEQRVGDDDLINRNTIATFGPDSLAEARNRGFRTQ